MLDDDGFPARLAGEQQLSLQGSVVTIGAFDGVHLGHQALIRAAVTEGWRRGLPSVVWTFDPPPKVAFGRAGQLCPLAEKLKRIASLGPDWIVVVRFIRTYAERSAADFLADLAQLSPRTVHVGADFRFGARQAGDVALLASRFNVSLARPVLCAGGEVISSSRIRSLEGGGNRLAAQLLLGPDPSGCVPGIRPNIIDTRHGEHSHGWI